MISVMERRGIGYGGFLVSGVVVLCGLGLRAAPTPAAGQSAASPGSSWTDSSTPSAISIPNEYSSWYSADYFDERYPNCSGKHALINDTMCNLELNNAACGFDGGDCCWCTNKYPYIPTLDCVDPDAPTLLHNCQDTPVAAAACSNDTALEWVVRDTTSAAALAKAVNCAGGTFKVEWRGSVFIDREIHLSGGTVLNVTGVDSTAEIFGNFSHRLFTVVEGSSLNLDNVILSGGDAPAGGAIAVSNSRLTLSNVVFARNVADTFGGSLYVVNSTTVLGYGPTTFNQSIAGGHGGAVYIDGGSSVTWAHADTLASGGSDVEGHSAVASVGAHFTQCFASGNGGAVYIDGGSNFTWAHADTLTPGTVNVEADSAVLFMGCYSDGTGGAMHVDGGSSVRWEMPADFSNNLAAVSGGALHVTGSSEVSWSAKTIFLGNGDKGSAIDDSFSDDFRTGFWEDYSPSASGWDLLYGAGGALFLDNGSTVSWDAQTEYVGNIAYTGGAVFVGSGATLSWGAPTEFILNSAEGDGGAVGSAAAAVDAEDDSELSSITFNGHTRFVQNECGGNGGGMVVSSALSLTFATEEIVFSENKAVLAGGGIFISGAGVAPQFVGASFISNSAAVGGGVFSTLSGNTAYRSQKPTDWGKLVHSPTTFIQCSFVGNEAVKTGGAVESSAGRALFNGTRFERNNASIGGALRLTGTTVIENCSFIENASSEGEGAAISNTGLESLTIQSCHFADNVFQCPQGKYLHFDESGDQYETVCDGCDSACENCTFSGDVYLCMDQLNHSTSNGGIVTVETLLIHPGYWRATNTSEAVLSCYKKEACLGGTTGTPDYCDKGYQGPYCSVCSDGFTAGLGVSCTACSNESSGLVLAVIVLIVCAAVLVAVLWYMIFGERRAVRPGIVSGISRFIPLQAIKITIVAWQILTQFGSVANVTYPGIYQNFLDWVDILNFDWSWILSTGCVVEVGFYDRLLLTTLTPLVAIAVLGCTYKIAMGRVREGSEAAVTDIRRRHLSVVLLLTFLVYSSVSSILFQCFACERLDDGNNYLRADYRIQCDSFEHRGYKVFAGFMLIVYTAGIPFLYGVLLHRNRFELVKSTGREDNALLKSTTDLWKAYKPDRFYYEIIECGRRVMLAGVVVFIFPNTPSQVAVTLVIAVFFMLLAEALAPYASRWDVWLSRAGHAIVFLSMYEALLLKVDLSEERRGGKQMFAVILVIAHICMIAAVAVEIVVMIFSLSKEPNKKMEPLVRGKGVVSFVYPVQGSEPGDEVPRAFGSEAVSSAAKTKGLSWSAFGTDNAEPCAQIGIGGDEGMRYQHGVDEFKL